MQHPSLTTARLATEIPDLAAIYLKVADALIEHLNAPVYDQLVATLKLTDEDINRLCDASFLIWEEVQVRNVMDYLAACGTVERLDEDYPFTIRVTDALELPDPEMVDAIGGNLDWRIDGDAHDFTVRMDNN
jgi:hypothetical protein